MVPVRFVGPQSVGSGLGREARYSVIASIASRRTLQTMNFPSFSALMRPASLSSLMWNEIVELNLSLPVMWQQTSPTVAPLT